MGGRSGGNKHHMSEVPDSEERRCVGRRVLQGDGGRNRGSWHRTNSSKSGLRSRRKEGPWQREAGKSGCAIFWWWSPAMESEPQAPQQLHSWRERRMCGRLQEDEEAQQDARRRGSPGSSGGEPSCGG